MSLPSWEAVAPDEVAARAAARLAEAQTWDVRAAGIGWEVATGLVVPAGGVEATLRAYRVSVEVMASPEAVAGALIERTLEDLPTWNREFRAGQELAERDAAGWRMRLLRVRYATPAPLKDRTYVYAFSSRRDADGSWWATYASVDRSALGERGALEVGEVEATLDASVHVLTPSGTGTRIEHILASDLGGAFPGWLQRGPMAGALVQAQARDAANLRRLFG